MSKLLIISRKQEIAKSILRRLKMSMGLAVEILDISRFEASYEGIIKTFNQIAAEIELKISEEKNYWKGPSPIAIIDLFSDIELFLPDLQKCNPLDIDNNCATLTAMLILVFPEIHWIIYSPVGEEKTLSEGRNGIFFDLKLITFAHLCDPCDNKIEDIISFGEIGYIPLFDPAGLRNLIRQNIEKSENKKTGIPLRRVIAASIDEESAYAYMHAYTAYRFGYRGHVMTTFSFMEEILNNKNNKESKDDRKFEPVKLTFEDLFLNFPDRRREAEGPHFSQLSVRDKHFEALKKAEKRIFITVGHRKTPVPSLLKENKAYLRRRRQKYKFLYKPLSGIFNLKRGARIEKPEGFEWPPGKTQSYDGDGGSHSAPGRLLLISEKLIERARKILNSTQSVEESVRGALLALEAQELLANKTPTTALEALSLKHQLEVSAECMFYGVQHNFEIKDRIKEIEKEVHEISKWFNPKTRKLSELNARLGIINALALIFRKYNQFDEENQCLKEIRKLHSNLSLLRNKSWFWLFYPLRRYIETLVGSLPLFILSVIFWPTLFGVIFFFSPGIKVSFVGDEFIQSFMTFFSLGKPDFLADTSFFIRFTATMEILLGFTHLGIFISYLYNLIFRR